jgi:hypothetical protein
MTNPLKALRLTAALLATAAAAQGSAQPAESAAERAGTPAPTPAEVPPAEPPPLGRTLVTGQQADDDLVGSYQQPVWTARRRFPSTRVYVVPEGALIFEYWTEVRTPFSEPASTRVRSLIEFEVGLGHHLQLDLYLRTEFKDGTFSLESERVELRWALADWGVIPGNPTLYFEWLRSSSGVMSAEVKLLLGGAFAKRWFWGANLSYERELWGPTQSNEYRATFAFAHPLIDGKLSLGAELQATLLDVRPNRFKFVEAELLLGPSLQVRPTPKVTVNLVWMLGFGAERSDVELPLASTFVMQPTVVLAAQF